MKIDLSFAHLHGPLFFANKNWGEKLDVKNTAKGKIQLSYDREHKELTVKCDGFTTIVPSSNIVSMTPIPEAMPAQVNQPLEAALNTAVIPPRGPGRPKAQVSGPHDHVFAQNAGKVRD